MPEAFLNDQHSPSTHALVIGVSRYRHLADGVEPTATGESFDIPQLSSAARSASGFAAWLLNEYYNPDAPLASLRLLISPSDCEVIHPDVDSRFVPGTDYSATLNATQADLIAFRNACNECRENVGIVYVAGHGVQFTKHGAVLLLEDFGSEQLPNVLSGTLDVTGCHAGLDNDQAANTQFWFVDACRQRPGVAESFEAVIGALSLDEIPGAAGTSAMILASQTREAALARIEGTSLFNEALLWALRGGAARGPGELPEWHVTAAELFTKVKAKVAELASDFEEEQNVDSAGRFGVTPIHRFQAPPDVHLWVDVEPSENAVGDLSHDGNTPIIQQYSDWPLEEIVPAGLYLLEVEAPPPLNSYRAILDVRPTKYVKQVRLQ